MEGQNMFTFVLLVTALFALPNVAFGTEYIVGDDRGWRLDVDYVAWAKGKTFHVGDKLVFKYISGMHTVNPVDENAYKNCIKPTTGILVSGNDIINLDTMGPKYFICGVGPHCEKGNQKLQINVEAAAGGAGATEGAANGTTITSSSNMAAPPTTTSNISPTSTAPAPSPSTGIRSTEFGVLVTLAISMMTLVF